MVHFLRHNGHARHKPEGFGEVPEDKGPGEFVIFGRPHGAAFRLEKLAYNRRIARRLRVQ
jgi:hypothetical protein